MSGAKEEPLFDSSRAALEFAFNAVKVIMPAPFMNKAMAEIKVKYRRTKKARKGFNKEALELLDAQDEHDMTSKGSAALLRPLRGLEAAAQAGIILKHVERLETPHKTILAGLTIRPSNPCSCCSPCCKGDRTDARWSQAVSTMCDLVREAGDITKTAGKRGLSSHPAMRWSMVEQFFTGREVRAVDVSRQFGVSLMTIAKHKEWIFTYLTQTENEAWQAVDLLFDTVGITGYLA